MIAAWIDTEGSIGAPKSSRGERYYLQVVISQRDPAPLKWLQSRVGGNLCRTARGGFRLQVSSQEAKRMLEGALPYFLSKGRQAELGIELGNKRRGSPKGRFGGSTSLVPSERQKEIHDELSRLKHLVY